MDIGLVSKQTLNWVRNDRVRIYAVKSDRVIIYRVRNDHELEMIGNFVFLDSNVEWNISLDI